MAKNSRKDEPMNEGVMSFVLFVFLIMFCFGSWVQFDKMHNALFTGCFPSNDLMIGRMRPHPALCVQDKPFSYWIDIALCYVLGTGMSFMALIVLFWDMAVFHSYVSSAPEAIPHDVKESIDKNNPVKEVKKPRNKKRKK
ncbi:hypothetical protein [Photorhabdus heterorhabditis]|uniref:Uncharacterized protein n=1 Tax=Photorhabdus heterorhabditis TaxID=880156 RepID=A0A5B0W9L3_9GAMM|nr:hypothetical protein [Photorhabdus heterorhabditis]KAA1183148.1 hypothetical protein F0L16_16160 [Photorhabdus heterorhabditis]